MPKDYKGEKTKPSMALIISVGPKMPKKPEDTATPDGKAMKKAWGLLKNITDMVEYPEGSGNFMSLRDMLEARNAQSRANLAQLDENLKQGYIRKPNVAVTPEKYPSTASALSSILTHASGRYDPNNPDAMHPMGSEQ